MNKIKVGLVFEDKDTAKKFVIEHAPCHKTIRESRNEFIYETSMMIFYWIKPFSICRGRRLNFVYTVEEIRDTEWFDTVVRPMMIVGTGAIDQNR